MHLSEQIITLSSSVYSLALEVCVCLFAVSLPTLQREYRLVLVTPSALTWVPLQSNIYIAWLITSPGSLCTLKRAKLPASFINRASGLEKNRCFNRQQNFIFFLSLAKFYPSSASSFISSTSTAPSGDPLIVTALHHSPPFAVPSPSHIPPVQPLRSGLIALAASESAVTTCGKHQCGAGGGREADPCPSDP